MTAPQNRKPRLPRGSDPGRISVYCGRGEHEKCKGRVYVYPAVDGETIVPCECKPCVKTGRHPQQWRGRPEGT